MGKAYFVLITVIDFIQIHLHYACSFACIIVFCFSVTELLKINTSVDIVLPCYRSGAAETDAVRSVRPGEGV
jgi:hypothetical protein